MQAQIGGWTLLHVASYYGPPEVVRLMVEHGADVEANRDDDTTTLQIASWNGQEKITNYRENMEPSRSKCLVAFSLPYTRSISCR